jgi:hypothetical protein
VIPAVNTDDLIRQIAAAGAPVRRLAPPWRRALVWLAIAVPYAAVVVWFYPATPAFAAMHGTRFMLEEFAAATTTLTAALAAFASIVPGYDRRILWLPLAPLALWLATLGTGCVSDWLRAGMGGLALRPDWDCLPPSLLLGWLPLTAMVLMLRRGAPLRPHLSVALGALAVAALANVGLQTFHIGDASIMVLFWHLGCGLLLSTLIGGAGTLVLSWRRARARALGAAA